MTVHMPNTTGLCTYMYYHSPSFCGHVLRAHMQKPNPYNTTKASSCLCSDIYITAANLCTMTLWTNITLRQTEPLMYIVRAHYCACTSIQVYMYHLYYLRVMLVYLCKRHVSPFLTDKGLHHIAYNILTYLDARSLCRAERVCSEWYRVIAEGLLWKKLIQRKAATDPVWKGLSERRGW